MTDFITGYIISCIWTIIMNLSMSFGCCRKCHLIIFALDFVKISYKPHETVGLGECLNSYVMTDKLFSQVTLAMSAFEN